MSDVQPAYDAPAAWAQIEAQQTARARLVEEAPPFSKRALRRARRCRHPVQRLESDIPNPCCGW